MMHSISSSRLRRFGAAARVGLLALAGALGLATSASAAISGTTYPLTVSTGATLEDMSSGTTMLVGPNADDRASSIYDIPFDFWMDGVRFNQFSAGANGIIRLGSVAVGTSFTNSLNSATEGPKICPLFDDLNCGTDGKVHYKVVGSSPTRKLVVEWKNSTVPRALNAVGTSTFQAWLNEGTGEIDFVYGAIPLDATNAGRSVGISSGTVGNFGSITTSAGTIDYVTVNDANTAAIASGTKYALIPQTVSSATSLTFTGVTGTGMTLNWANPGGAQIGTAIYRSYDGTTYDFITQTGSGITTYSGTGAGSGLGNSSTYFWSLVAVGPGCSATALTGSQATTATSGTPLAAGTYEVGGAPAPYSTIAAAVTDLNTKGISGNVILELRPDYSVEAGTITAPTVGGQGATILIRPRSDVVSTINLTSAIASNAKFRFDGAHYVTLDGRAGGAGTTSFLTIGNSSTSATALTSAALFINDAAKNTITYCGLQGSGAAVTTGVLVFSTTTGVTGNDSNTVSNSNIGPSGANLPFNGVLSLGTNTSTVVNDLNNGYNAIDTCNISDYFSAASITSGLMLQAGNTNWTVNGNRFFQSASRAYTTANTHNVIQIEQLNTATTGVGFSITNNIIGFATSAGTGTYTMTSGVATRFIGIGIGSLNNFAGRATVTGNQVSNASLTTSSGAATTNGVWCGINMPAAGAITCTGNTIGSVTATGNVSVTPTTSGALILGINVGSGTPYGSLCNVSSNNIGGITGTGSALGVGTTVMGIQAAGTSASYTISSNLIGSTTVTDSLKAVCGAGAGTGACVVRGITNAGSASVTISSNTIQNLTGTNSNNAASLAIGINNTAGLATITSNKISALTSTGANVTVGAGAAAVGISQSGTTVVSTISQNDIYNLKAIPNAVGTAVSVNGIVETGGAGLANVIERNWIHSLKVDATGTGAALINGLNVTGGNTTFQNNIIRLGLDESGASIANSTFLINAIRDVPAALQYYYHNTIYIGGTATGVGTADSACYFKTATGVATELRSNIMVNARTNSGPTGRHFVYNLSSSGSGSLTSTGLNYNAARATGTGALFGIVTASTYASRSLWNSSTGFDANSVSDTLDPQLLTPTAALTTRTSSGGALHVDAVTQTPIESAGDPSAGIAAAVPTDFDGETRSGLTPVDIGADAGNFTVLDLAGPAISASLADTASQANRAFAATITDQTGVDTSGGNAPVLFWRRNAGSYQGPISPGSTSGAATNLTANFTIDYSLAGGITVGDVIQYSIQAKDTAIAGPFSGSLPSGTAYNTNPPTTTNSYTILFSVTSYPYTQDFETDNGNYTSAIVGGAVNDWEYGTPAKPGAVQLTGAYSGTKCWMTKLSVLNYSNSANCAMISPILNFSGFGTDPQLEFYHTFNFEASDGWDSAVLEKSTNGGTVWTKVDGVVGTGTDYNTATSTRWYNSTSTNNSATVAPPKWSTGTIVNSTGYAGDVPGQSGSTGWLQSRTTLTGTAGLSDVRLRWRFGSDTIDQGEGWAVDNIKIASELTPPTIAYTALGNTQSTANRSLVATISDTSGLDVTPNEPKLFYKKSTDGAYVSAVDAAPSGSTYTFTIDYAMVGGGSASVGDVIQYYVAAKDTVGNETTLPVGGTMSTAPSSPASYTITPPPLAGDYQIPGAYATLTAGVADLNVRGVSAAVRFLLTTGYDSSGETFPIVINETGGTITATNNFKIKPDTGQTISLSGSGNSIIEVLNTSYVTIDGDNGSSGRNMTIENTNGAATRGCVLFLSVGTTTMTNCALQNCIVYGPSQTVTPVAALDTGLAAGGYFAGLNIINNDIRRGFNGFFMAAAVLGTVTGTVIDYNNMDTSSPATDSLVQAGIILSNTNGTTVYGNSIGNWVNTTSGSSFVPAGILLQGGLNATIDSNKVYDIQYGGTGGFGAKGIAFNGAGTGHVVKNNMIAGMTGDGDSGTSSSFTFNPMGIRILTATGVQVYNNSIMLTGSTLGNATFTGGTSYGIVVDTGATADVRNNSIVNNLGRIDANGRGAVGMFLSTSAAQLTGARNNFYSINPTAASVEAIGQIAAGGTPQTTVAAWQALLGGGLEANSFGGVDAAAVSAGYTSAVAPYDLHIGCSSPLLGVAQTGLLAVDLDANTRSATYPDIGADEIVDTTAPTVVTQDIAVSLDSGGNVTVLPSQVNNGSSDNCGAAILVSVVPNGFSCASTGVHPVVLTVRDAKGNEATGNANVTVSDTTGPTIGGCAPGQSDSVDGTANAVVPDFTGALSGLSDNCTASGSLTITQNPVAGALRGYSAVPWPVVITVKDASLNQTTCNASFTVNDTTAPTASITLLDSTPTNANSVQFSVDFSEPVAPSFTTADITANLTGGLTALGATVGLSGPTGSDVYTVTLTFNDANANGTAGITLDGVGGIVDQASNAYAGGTSSLYTVDNTGLTASITLTDPNPTNINAVHFDVLFSAAVGSGTVFNASDVTLIGTLAAGSTVGVTGAAASYTVTVTLGSPTADGTIGLDLPAGAGVKDGANNNFLGSTSGVYNIDNTGPDTAVTGPSGTVTQTGSAFNVFFNASDAFAGVQTVHLYYQKSARAYTEYGSGFVTSPISFDTATTGGDGTYDLYTVGEDLLGNIEVAPGTPDVTVMYHDNTTVRDWTTLDNQ